MRCPKCVMFEKQGRVTRKVYDHDWKHTIILRKWYDLSSESIRSLNFETTYTILSLKIYDRSTESIRSKRLTPQLSYTLSPNDRIALVFCLKNLNEDRILSVTLVYVRAGLYTLHYRLLYFTWSYGILYHPITRNTRHWISFKYYTPYFCHASRFWWVSKSENC